MYRFCPSLYMTHFVSAEICSRFLAPFVFSQVSIILYAPLESLSLKFSSIFSIRWFSAYFICFLSGFLKLCSFISGSSCYAVFAVFISFLYHFPAFFVKPLFFISLLPIIVVVVSLIAASGPVLIGVSGLPGLLLVSASPV